MFFMYTCIYETLKRSDYETQIRNERFTDVFQWHCTSHNVEKIIILNVNYWMMTNVTHSLHEQKKKEANV